MHDLEKSIINRLKKDVKQQKEILVNERLKEMGLKGVSFTREEGQAESYWHEENGIDTRIITFLGFEFETNFVGNYNESFNFVITMQYF